MAKKSKTKTKFLKSRIKFDKTLVAVIISVLTVVAGYLYYVGTNAYSGPPSPPIQYIAAYVVSNVKTSDGVTGTTAMCFNSTYSTPYGPATFCIDGSIKSGTTIKVRFGVYNVATKTFLPSTGWLAELSPFYGTDAQVGSYVPIHFVGYCPAISNTARFYGFGPVSTSFGPVYYGEIFRINSAGNWIEEQGTFSGLTKSCSGTGTWYPITINTILA